MYIIVVSGGRIGFHLAENLRQRNHTVVLIERNPEICQRIAEKLDVVVIQGDGCDTHCLEQAGIERAEVIAAVTNKDEDNLIICQLAKEKFNIRRTIARVNNPKKEHLFHHLGVDIPINSTSLIAKVIEEESSFEDISQLISLKKGKLVVVKINLPENSPVLNQPIKEIKIPSDTVIISVMRRDDFVIPHGETVLEAGDDLLAITKIEKEKELLKFFLGKGNDKIKDKKTT
jgi:trk system potassium uptake protein TrkA